MSKHFLTLVGTNLYEPVIYSTDSFTSSIQEFVQLAIIEQHYDELKSDPNAKLTFFVTTKSKQDNYEDRTYNASEVNIAKNFWSCEQKNELEAGKLKKGLKTQLEEQFPDLADKADPKIIETPNDEKMLGKIFNDIFKELREGDEIIFDITHSFRSLPMLALTVINYAKVLKNCSLEQVCYGAYETAPKEKQGVKNIPIINLTFMDEILSWTNAADSFMRYGNASMMNSTFNTKYNSLPVEQQDKWNSVSDIVKKASILSDSLQTGRGMDCKNVKYKEADDRQECSIKNAYETYATAVRNAVIPDSYDMKPITPLLKKVDQRYSVLNHDTNYEVGMSVVEWAISNDMIQQGYTALEETAKTYLCWKYYLDETNKTVRDDIVGSAMTCLAKKSYGKGKKLIQTKEQRALFFDNEVKTDKFFLSAKGKNSNAEVIWKTMIIDDNVSIALIIDQIKNFRNDINHFGFQTQPAKSSKLKEKLVSQYNSLKTIIEANNGQRVHLEQE